MLEVPVLKDIDLAFPERICDFVPSMDKLDDRYKDDSSKYSRFFWALMGDNVVSELVGMRVKKGVDPDMAWRLLYALMSTLIFSYEHKMAAFSYFVDQWFGDVRWQQKDGEVVRFEDEQLDRKWETEKKRLDKEGLNHEGVYC